MLKPQGRLALIAEKLDALGSSYDLVKIAGILAEIQLSIADVGDFVATNPRNYNRSRVVSNDHYELLIMTWLPGQASAPHDHAGSICVMQVLQGNAVEASYRVAQDGYIDLEFESEVKTNEITSGQDAGIHAVRNSSESSEVLVTVHIYSPPLRDFRRFVERPQRVASGRNSIDSRRSQPASVIVVGGGFSGAMTAAHLLNSARKQLIPLNVTLVERRGAIGEGVAYGTRDLCHLLNVPAGRMSAWPNVPEDFLTWVNQNKGTFSSGDFLPRQWYGEYIRETLLSIAENAQPLAKLRIVLDEVRRISRHSDRGWLVHVGRGPSERADAVVLAVGHRPPDDPIGQNWEGARTRYLVDPWQPLALDGVGPDDDVLILGSGLSAVDAVLTLTKPRRTAPITLLSRRGLLPQSHSPVPLTPIDLGPIVDSLLADPQGVRVVELFRKVRRLARELAEKGGDWRCVVDGLRPHTFVLWRGMSLVEKRRFIRHLRPFWEVHRHRMALDISEKFGQLHDAEKVHFLAGRVVSARGSDSGVELVVEQRRAKHRLAVHAGWVINCTGPTPSNIAAANPAVGSLLVDGWLSPDVLLIGIEVGETGHAIGRSGESVDDLYVVGTLRKAQDWESTAVPELRIQAANVAQKVIEGIFPQQTAPL